MGVKGLTEDGCLASRGSVAGVDCLTKDGYLAVVGSGEKVDYSTLF